MPQSTIPCTGGETVALIQDNVPWAAAADQDPLGADATELRAQQQSFCVLSSSDVGRVNLTQFPAIVIAAAQTQAFYDNLFPNGTILSALSTYVQQGGHLAANLAAEADGPGNGGTWAGESFVGGLSDATYLSDDNAIADTSSPLITGQFGGTNGGQILDSGTYSDLDGWFYSSHGYFTNLPAGTETSITDEFGRPVAIEYPFGSGRVIATLTTSEFRYVGGLDGSLPENRKLLANEIGYLIAALPAHGCLVSGTGLNSCDLQAGDVLFAHDPNPFTLAEATLFAGYWAHVGIYNGDGTVTEALFTLSLNCLTWQWWKQQACTLQERPGVVVHSLRASSWWNGTPPRDWAVLRVHTDASTRLNVVNYAKSLAGKPYNFDYLDPTRTDKFYCSQLVWQAYERYGIDLDSHASALGAGLVKAWAGPWGLAKDAAVALAIPPDDLYFTTAGTIVEQRPGLTRTLGRVVFRLLSPGAMLVTDGQGRRTGYDPATGQILDEIPDTSYSGPGTEPQVLVADQMSGTWRIDVIGLGTGPGTLLTETANPDSHTFRSDTGGLAPGTVITYQFTNPGTPGQPPVLTPPSPRPVTWSSWNSQGGILTDAPAAAGFNGRVYVFARGSDQALYVKSSADGVIWTGWSDQGGILTAAPAAASANGKLYVFAKGSDNALYVKSSTDGVTWTGWTDLGGILTAPPAAAGLNGTLYVFAKGSDNALYLKRSHDGTAWTDWQDLGGILTAAPAATGFRGQVYVFAKGSDNALYVKSSADGATFTGWQSYGGILTAAPAAASFAPAGGPEALYTLAKGTDNALYERHTSDGATWSGWQSLGGQLLGPPAAAGVNGQLFTFAWAPDNALWERHTQP